MLPKGLPLPEMIGSVLAVAVLIVAMSVWGTAETAKPRRPQTISITLLGVSREDGLITLEVPTVPREGERLTLGTSGTFTVKRVDHDYSDPDAPRIYVAITNGIIRGDE